MKLSLFIFLVFSALTTFAQTKISGKVTDEKGEPVPGANISIQDTYDGTTSGLDGSFAFTTIEKGSRVLVISFVGYKTFQQPITIDGTPVTVAGALREEINQLDAVTVSAGSFTAGEEKRRTILKAVDIAMTAGATADIAGALNTLPGTTKVGETGRLFVRGGDSDEARTFIDGMVVLNAYSPSAPNTPSRGRFLPFMFKGTSFSTGGYSAEYGQALSSALVLNSKDKAEYNQTDIGILSVGGDIAHTQVWDNSSLSGKIQYTNIRPYFKLIDQRVDWHTPPLEIDGSAVYRLKVGKEGMFKFFGNGSISDFSMYNHDVANPEIKQLFELSNRYGYGNMAYTQPLSEKWSVRGGMSFNYNENDTKTDGLPALEKERGLHTKIVFENSLSDNIDIRVGGEMFNRHYSASKQFEKSQPVLSQSFDESISSAFAEAEAYASKHFVVKAGTRFEYNALNNHYSTDPRLSLAYKPGTKGQFSFAYGFFRQSAKNMYLRADNRLAPEKAEHFILNYQVITDNRTFRVEAFYKNYFDLVKYGNPEGTLLNNSGFGYARGIDFFWRDNRSIRNVDYWVSYSYLDTQRDYLNYPGMAVPTFASTHNFSVVYKHFISKLKSQVGITWSYASPRTYFNPNNSSFNSDTTPYYSDLSANVAYLPKNWLIIYFSCTNLLGRDNVFGYSYSTTPDASGVYASVPVLQPALRFVFVGVLITISKNKSVNQLPNL